MSRRKKQPTETRVELCAMVLELDASHEDKLLRIALDVPLSLGRKLAPFLFEEASIVFTKPARATPKAQPLDVWHEDVGPVLWWCFPIDEPPWVGGPNDSDWPGYHTHWTPLPPIPETP
jgi:hypothetical protein